MTNKAMARLDRDEQIWSEWVSGQSQRQIGERRGVSSQAISQAIGRYLATVPEPERDVYRARILARHEELYLAHREAALERPRVAAIVRGILDSEARLLGLVQNRVHVDGQVDHVHHPGPSVAELLDQYREQGLLQVQATRIDQ